MSKGSSPMGGTGNWAVSTKPPLGDPPHPTSWKHFAGWNEASRLSAVMDCDGAENGAPLPFICHSRREEASTVGPLLKERPRAWLVDARRGEATAEAELSPIFRSECICVETH